MTYELDEHYKVVLTIGGVRKRGYTKGYIVTTLLCLEDSYGKEHRIKMYLGEPEEPGYPRPWFIDPSKGTLFETDVLAYGAANSAESYTRTPMLPQPVYSNSLESQGLQL